MSGERGYLCELPRCGGPPREGGPESSRSRTTPGGRLPGLRRRPSVLSAAIAAFGQQFVKTGALEPSLHQHLLNAFDLRNLGDYGAVRAVEDADARQVLEDAKVFCAAAKAYLASSGPA